MKSELNGIHREIHRAYLQYPEFNDIRDKVAAFVPIIIYSRPSERISIIFAGNRDFQDKTLADVAKRFIGFSAVVIAKGLVHSVIEPEITLYNDLSVAFGYVKLNAKDICGADKPELTLFCFSDGESILEAFRQKFEL